MISDEIGMPGPGSAGFPPQMPQMPMQGMQGMMGKLLIKKPKNGAAEKEILEYVQKILNQAKKDRIPVERQWYVNLAFYSGKHYVQWINTTNNNYARLVEPAMPHWRVRHIVNKVRVIVRTELAKLMKEQPRGFVIPQSTDEEDIHAARAGDAIIEHLHRELRLRRQLRRALFWTSTCGVGFMKDWYDSTAIDSSGMQGAVKVEPTSPFHIYVPDLQEEELENQHCVIHATGKDPIWVEKTFGVKLQADTSSSKGEVDSKLLSALNLLQSPNRNYVTFYEAWIKPCSKFPEGALVQWCQDKLLNFHEGWPYGYNDYPFTKLEHIPTGKFYSESTVTDLIPIQKEYNRTRSQIIEAKNRMAKPQLIAPVGSVDPTKITSEPGLIVFYKVGYQPPQPLQLQPLPQYVMQDLQMSQQDMNDISSQHEITKGSTPPGVTAATAISYLQEEDDSKLAYTIASIEEGVEKINGHLLQHVVDRWVAERQIRVIGQNNQFETLILSQETLKGNTTWVVEAGSAIPRSRAAKQAFIMELGKMGWIPPQKALQYLDMAETGKLYEETQVDSRQAQRENLYLKLGKQVPPNLWDNHLVHIMEHDGFRKREVYESLDPMLQQSFEMHVQGHKIMLAQAYGRFDLIVPGQSDPMTGQPGPPQISPLMEGFIYQLMSGGGPAMQQAPQTSDQQTSVQDEAQQ